MNKVESLSGIVTFVTTAKSSSFTEAAEVLGVSKSAVGKSIAKLEERVGVKLFHRTTRKVSLTADGQAYFQACTNAISEISFAESSLGAESVIPSGRLRIDMPVAYGKRVIWPILRQIGKEYRDLELTITFTDHLIDPIEEGIDLAIRLGDLGNTTGLVAKKLFSEPWLICASPEYIEQFGCPRTIEELEGHKCIVGYRRNQPLSWKVNLSGQNKRISPPATYQIGDGEAIIEACLEGFGICQMPKSLMNPYLQSGELTQVLSGCVTEPINVYAVWPQTAHLRPKVRHVVDVLAETARLNGLKSQK